MFMESNIGGLEVRRNSETDEVSLVEITENTTAMLEYNYHINNLINTLNDEITSFFLIDDYLTDHQCIEKPIITIEQFEKLEKCSEITDCSICFENMKDNIKLKCDHIFCNRCIKKWLTEKSNTCPTCRKEVQM